MCSLSEGHNVCSINIFCWHWSILALFLGLPRLQFLTPYCKWSKPGGREDLGTRLLMQSFPSWDYHLSAWCYMTSLQMTRSPMPSSLVPRLHMPPGEKWSGEQSRISWAYYPNVVMANEIARSVIITRIIKNILLALLLLSFCCSANKSNSSSTHLTQRFKLKVKYLWL